MRRGKKKVMTVAILPARNVKKCFCGANGGGLMSEGRLCVGAFYRNPGSVTMKMFYRLIYCNFVIFNMICKDNSATNSVLFHTETIILVNSDWSYYAGAFHKHPLVGVVYYQQQMFHPWKLQDHALNIIMFSHLISSQGYHTAASKK